MVAVKISSLKKHFGSLKALDGISFDVKEGEIFGFLGPNGAGKTTTIRVLMDFIRPTSGTVEILGTNAQENSVLLKKDIGYLASDNQLYEGWTGQDHISFSEKINGQSTNIDSLLSSLQFNPKLRVKTLSTGNKKKLALILALMHQPKLLILDEPTNGLDPLLQNTFYKIIKELRAKGTTVLMSSHNLPEVEAVSDRIGIIKDGKMVAVESIAHLKNKRIYEVSVRFDKKPDLKRFAGENYEIITSEETSVRLQVKGDINILLDEIAKLKVEDIQIEPARLEDIFLTYYE